MRRLGYLPALDGLRGVAILLVIGVHSVGYPVGGDLGVDLFFVLSGFLITTLLLEERTLHGRVNLRAFYARRARRLFPALALLLVAYAVIATARGEDGLARVAEYGLYGGNVFQAFAVSGVLPKIGLEHLWSLAQEEQFYLVAPVILVALAGVRRPLRCLGALFVLLVAYRLNVGFHGASWQRLYPAPDTHSEGLVAGCLVAFWRVRAESFRVPEAAVRVAFAVFVFGFVAYGAWFLLPIYELAAAVLVAAAVTETEFSKALSAGWLVWVGGISYSLYLWHFVLLWAFRWHDRGAVVVLSFAVAYASTRWIEKPFRRPRPEPAGLPAVENA